MNGARQALRAALDAHQPADDAERRALQRIVAFTADDSAWFDRTRADGHLTASAVIVDRDASKVLLIHHRKLDRWLQPGGHGEPDDLDPIAIALREAKEETGLGSLIPWTAAPSPFDVDVHGIPARPARPGKRGELAHEHLDLRYAFVAELPSAGLELQTTEVVAAAWFSINAPFPDEDQTMSRLRRKVAALLQRS